MFPELYAKESKDIKDIDEKRKYAINFVDSYFDIRNIMEELSELKVLVKVLMDPYQKNLVLMCALQEYTKEVTTVKALLDVGVHLKIDDMINQMKQEENEGENQNITIRMNSEQKRTDTGGIDQKKVQKVSLEKIKDRNKDKKKQKDNDMVLPIIVQERNDEKGGETISLRENKDERRMDDVQTTILNIRYLIDEYIIDSLRGSAFDIEDGTIKKKRACVTEDEKQCDLGELSDRNGIKESNRDKMKSYYKECVFKESKVELLK